MKNFRPNGGLALAIVFLIAGLVYMFKPEWIVRFRNWQYKAIGSKWTPKKWSINVYRVAGLLFLIFGLILLVLR